ncbi:unnamed protein product [Phaedon cochleariae]|uniref:Uncharacterized protein n=1 Tax=Phaedon cochleariae TaxID=80249 RepID=A0A9P0DMN7_PHACE|nr:unnamed protein product [Phaedon cochleariae]
MCEITTDNFEDKFPEIKNALEKSKFISIDLEFSALYPLKNHAPSLFDSPVERYSKLRRNIEHVIPIQVGLTAFSFDGDRNSYLGTIFNFYVVPASFPSIQKTFMFQSDTISFLRFYDFDFNKFAYSGVPFINRTQEEDLRKRLKNNDITDIHSNFKSELEHIHRVEGEQIQNWYSKAKEGDELSIPTIYDKFKNNYEILYFLHKNYRRRFHDLWTAVENGAFVIRKLPTAEIRKLEITQSIEEELISNLLGFTKVFRLLTTLGKPIIGHNSVQDILLLIESFEAPLPHSYRQFKKLTTSLFPTIFDTKHIAYELKSSVQEDKQWNDKGLESLFDYFKNGTGRHLAVNSPAIEVQDDKSFGKYHEAGWDSFCSGYIFIRLAYLNVYRKYPKSKNFVSCELIAGLSEYKNKVNVIRGSVSYMRLDDADPVSNRPPFLVIESVDNKPVSIPQVSSILSSFGFVEIRKFPYQRKRALVAVDNFGNARRILNNFKSHDKFHVSQYSTIRHSSLVRSCILGGITMSGVLLIWITHSVMKK